MKNAIDLYNRLKKSKHYNEFANEAFYQFINYTPENYNSFLGPNDPNNVLFQSIRKHNI